MIDFDFHPTCIFVLPALAFTSPQCSDPGCGELHAAGISLAWLCWTIFIGVKLDDNE